MRQLLLFCSLLLLFSCQSQKDVRTGNSSNSNPPPSDTACTLEGIVDDLTGLDGCGLVILVNNEKWMPINLSEQEVTLEKNQLVRFGYKILDDVVSMCMAEDKIIELTCLEVLGKTGGIKPAKPKCPDVQEAKKVDWMNALIKIHRADRVVKYPSKEKEWVYLFQNKALRMLYSCEGNLICKAKNGERNDCTNQQLANLKDGIEVYQAEEPGN